MITSTSFQEMFIYLGKKYIAKLSCHLENNEQQQQKSRDN